MVYSPPTGVINPQKKSKYESVCWTQKIGVFVMNNANMFKPHDAILKRFAECHD